MNRKAVVKTPAPILVITLFISAMTGCGMKGTKSTETSAKISRLFPDYMVEMCTVKELKGVQFVGRGNGVADENAPSGTTYTDGSGHTHTNLGVHEHWNNSEQKLYS